MKKIFAFHGYNTLTGFHPINIYSGTYAASSSNEENSADCVTSNKVTKSSTHKKYTLKPAFLFNTSVYQKYHKILFVMILKSQVNKYILLSPNSFGIWCCILGMITELERCKVSLTAFDYVRKNSTTYEGRKMDTSSVLFHVCIFTYTKTSPKDQEG